jgi:uncharacterized protein (TIGR02246 family)
MKRVALALAMSTIVCVSGALAEKPNASADEIAIRKGVESYVEAYNRADTHAMASCWSREGEYVAPNGEQRAKGPEEIQKALAAFFAQNKDMRLNATVSHVEILSPDRAVAKGKAAYVSSGEPPEDTQFIATYQRENGQWKLLTVEEDESVGSSDSPGELTGLAWLIGEWVDQDEDSSVETIFQWTKNYRFISGSFRVAVKDRIDLEGTQVIGWDPVNKKIRSWLFDSSGGFGEGTWSQEGNRWVVKMHSYLSTGEKTSAVNIYTPVDANTFTWQSIGREVGGELLPNIDEVTVIRKHTQEK